MQVELIENPSKRFLYFVKLEHDSENGAGKLTLVNVEHQSTFKLKNFDFYGELHDQSLGIRAKHCQVAGSESKQLVFFFDLILCHVGEDECVRVLTVPFRRFLCSKFEHSGFEHGFESILHLSQDSDVVIFQNKSDIFAVEL